MSCKYTRVNESIIQILWYKDGSLVDLSALDAEIMNGTNSEKILKFNNLDHKKHDGKYICKSVIKNQQEIESNAIKIKIQCKFTYSNIHNKI